MAYRDFESVPLTSGDSIEKGSVSLQHLDPALYLQVQQIKLHTHTGVDSQILKPEATPYVLKALGPQNREEHGLASGTGEITFTTPFQAAPYILLGPTTSSGAYATSVSTSGFQLNGGAAYWMAIGR